MTGNAVAEGVLPCHTHGSPRECTGAPKSSFAGCVVYERPVAE
uniref:Uncharacterized protein n=1 Tax=Anguilla anguilla TaxID=7936 RepID=A0A0E9SZF3_ANGAN